MFSPAPGSVWTQPTMARYRLSEHMTVLVLERRMSGSRVLIVHRDGSVVYRDSYLFSFPGSGSESYSDWRIA